MGSADKTVELTVEETNALRAKLGLKPLRVSKPKDGEAEKRKRKRDEDQQGAEEQQENTGLKEKLQAIREERLAKEKLDAGAVVRPLGEADGDDDEDDATAWIQKSRRKEKEEALRMQRALMEQEEFDGEEGAPSQRKPGDKYRSKQLKGLKIGHGAEQFREGTQVVLTLKDQGVLDDDGEVHDGEDVLEETLLAQQEKRDEALRLSKPKGKYKDENGGEDPGSGGLLSKYDDPEHKTTADLMEIDGSGRVDVAKLREQEEIRKKLREGVNYGKTKESADPMKRAMDDFWTPEEASLMEKAGSAGKKKRRKKKKNIRMKRADIDDLEAQALAREKAEGGEGDAEGGHHGKRVEGMRTKQNAETYLTEQARRDAAYSKAMSKAAEKTAEAFEDKTMAAEGGQGAAMEEDGEEDEFFSALNRARASALSRQRKVGSDATALAAKSLPIQDQVPGSLLYTGEVFTEASEFTKTISARNETAEERAPEPEPEPAEAAEAVEAAPTASRAGEASTSGAAKAAEGAGPSGSGADQGVGLASEGRMDRGIGGALKLLQDRGELRKTVRWAGRTNDKKHNNVRDVIESYSDQTQFAQDIESALTRKDEFGRVMTPKEAFRQLCYKFHGIKASKNKQEKKIKKYLEEQKMMEMGNL